jgi:hypothetical protein
MSKLSKDSSGVPFILFMLLIVWYALARKNGLLIFLAIAKVLSAYFMFLGFLVKKAASL